MNILKKYFAKEHLLAIKIVWLILTIIIIIVLIFPFLFNDNIIKELTPKCTKLSSCGEECFFCGTTRAFIHISKGEFQEAQYKNQGSLFLYCIFIINIVIFIFQIIKTLFSK